jgi:cytochrome d ubiquinol oxidase subunit I
LASIAAWSMLKGRKDAYVKKVLRLTLTVSFIFAVVTILVGDLSGKYLAAYQPVKLAAAEWHFETSDRASLYVGGVLDPNTKEISYALELPWMLSILVGHVPSTVVQGLNDFPKDLQPPLFIHYLFDGMVGLGTYLTAISGFYLF